MRDYNLTVDGFITGGATDAEFEGLVVAHNVMNALLSPYSQVASEILGYIDEHMVGSRFFNQEKVTAFRDGVAEFYRVDPRFPIAHSQPEHHAWICVIRYCCGSGYRDT